LTTSGTLTSNGTTALKNTTVTGTLGVTGASTLAALTTSGTLTSNGTTVLKNTTVTGTLTTTGTTASGGHLLAAAGQTVMGGLQIGTGGLTMISLVGGNATLNNTTVNGTLDVTDMTHLGDTILTGNFGITGWMVRNGNFTLGGILGAIEIGGC
jgi:hypothetical protein